MVAVAEEVIKAVLLRDHLGQTHPQIITRKADRTTANPAYSRDPKASEITPTGH